MDDRSSVRSLIAGAAFRHRGSAGAGLLVRQVFARASRLLPVRRVAETPHVLAFHHPVPGFEPVHVLLVPKIAARSMMHLTAAQREQVSAEVELIAREALATLGRADSGFVVVANGGTRQDVRQVHFHLVTDGYELASPPSKLTPGSWTDHPDPSYEVHQVREGDEPVLAGLEYAAKTRDCLQLERRGYSIVWDARSTERDRVLHLTAGKPSRSGPRSRGPGARDRPS